MYKKQLILEWIKSNKKLMIIWITIGTIIFVLIFPPKFIVLPNQYGRLVIIDNCWIFEPWYWDSSSLFTINWGRTFTYVLVITLMGGLLIYTFMSKKNNGKKYL